MSTFVNLKAMVAARVTGSGINYNVSNNESNIELAINWAQQEFCVVQWQLLHKYLGFDTVSSTIQYSLYDTDGSVYDFNTDAEVWYWSATASAREKLVKCTESDINTIGAAQTAATPQFYAMGGYINDSGASIDVRSIHIGMPTADAAYPIRVYYYRTLPDLSADADESLISLAYNDNPIIEGAVWKFAQLMSIESSPELFYREMKIAQGILPYSGPSYPENLQSPGRE